MKYAFGWIFDDVIRCPCMGIDSGTKFEEYFYRICFDSKDFRDQMIRIFR